MSATQTVVLEIQKTDKKRNSFFKHQNTLCSGAPAPTPPDGSKTVCEDDQNDSNKKHDSCCLIS
ncbi:hypothetical protein Lqui_2060 [Legionella quinlivanii]|uniref:Uncharacterized protein n=1 Tax=Legionella quinlivanii TaxID=45073 RepID=A0A0W0XUS0_9GAMM|nr:hypothetical protein [Legionella quinlivanii]KTD48249.1 hypothetical protein Lqui_2060 [Legionella quinlivanii]MCW8450517.1 hypothetical protein [Legionella quinlivanii]SEF97760.1 hypothetical protein SAMN02746093_01552 [Legionella quinlivanii DSM 21216]STY11303.1 Uncharacterised protein [Legionella quinlivanii]